MAGKPCSPSTAEPRGRLTGTGLLLALAWVLAVPAPALPANLVKVGLMEEPKTLNVLYASDRWTNQVLSLIYQPLVERDPESLEIVPWLAAEVPAFDPATVSYTVRLRDDARWADGSPLTAEDVAFTARLILEFKIPKYYSKWDFVTRIETPDEHSVRFYLKEPQAVFLSRTLETPVLSRKEWAAVAEQARGTENPLQTLLNTKVESPLGAGPFALQEWRQGTYLYLKRSPAFFGSGKTIAGRLLGPHCDGVLFKFFGTADAAVLALKKGDIDMFWWGIQPGYLDDLRGDAAIDLFQNEQSALYYLGFNVRKPPFSDPVLRRAVATLVDKQFILQRILQGHGTPMETVVPPGNRFWCCPDPQLHGAGHPREERIRRAHAMLRDAGYTWESAPVDAAGRVVPGRGLRLPDGSPMTSWTILTPPADYDPLRAMSGTIVQEWLKEFGMPATAKPMAFSALLEQVKVRQDFDAFILAYGSLSLDPDYLRSFFHSANDKPRGWNMSGYRNPEFDRLADASVSAVDPGERQKLIWEMQRLVARDVPYLPLYNPQLIEAVRKDRFSGWIGGLGGIGNVWSFCALKPL